MRTANTTTAAAKSRFTTKELVLAGMFAAVLAVISQLSIPLPTGVPITIQVFGIALTGAVLGWRLGLFATLVYILLGAVGLPVFANFQGGIRVLAGVTGGYIWAWPFMAALCGIRPAAGGRSLNLAISLILALAGLALVEIAGGLQWAALSGDQTVWGVFVYSMVAFVPKDIVITVLGVLMGGSVRRLIGKQMR